MRVIEDTVMTVLVGYSSAKDAKKRLVVYVVEGEHVSTSGGGREEFAHESIVTGL